MAECVVVGCAQEAEVIAGKPTPWGAWEYWVCPGHKAEADGGAVIHDQPDGLSIILHNAPDRAANSNGTPTSRTRNRKAAI